MARKTAAQWLEKWGRNLGTAGQDIKDGVNALSVAPGEAAAAAQDRMLANLIESIQSGRWAQAVSGVSLADWKTAMIEKGIPRLSQGIAGAKRNKVAEITELLANVDAAAAAANQIPKGDINASMARANAFMLAMHESSKRGKAQK